MALRPSQRAAQYLRMSTEHQQYSTANQKDAIADYAGARGISIVATYEDSGKSGLTLSGRPSLRKLIADVVAGQAAFDIILVYDISRWGRFQDADESAHLEYLCRLSGVRVEYCAEPFSNDGTPFASICKVVKRALAAEYSRELSEKVYAGKRRLIGLGFRQGGSAGYGLRRCLIDQAGTVKGVLARGEYKSIATDRVILIPGPPEEVAIVRRIFRDYIERGMGRGAIAAALNEEGISSESGRPWSGAVVQRVLTSEKYIGDSVWGRQSFKLSIKRRNNSPDTWIRYNGAFEAIINRSLFDKAQKIRRGRARQVSDDEIVERLRKIHRQHGKITTRLLKRDGLRGPSSIRHRFGSLVSVYALAGYQPKRDLKFISRNGTGRRLRSAVAHELVSGVRAQGGTVVRVRGACRFCINGEMNVSIAVVQQRRSQRGNPRWRIKQGGTNDDLTVAVLMDGPHERARSFYFLPPSEIGNGVLLALRNPAGIEAFRADDLQPMFELCRRCEPGVAGWRQRSPDKMDMSARQPVKKWIRQFRSHSAKSYSGAFFRASTNMRSAITRADVVHARLVALRSALAPLLVDARFVRLLATHGIVDFPACAFADDEHPYEKRTAYLADLRRQALALLGGSEMTKRARDLFNKLTPERRVEAAENIVLVNDTTEYFVRALVASTPEEKLADWPRKHIYGPRQRELRAVVEEGDFIYREGKRALALFGPSMLDLVVLKAFVRRMMAVPAVTDRLEVNSRSLLRDLRGLAEDN